ncbi:MAG: hypothetical protein RLZZ293_195 [Pseudomonadota bacterium]|jgi:CRISPR-associated protein Cas1
MEKNTVYIDKANSSLKYERNNLRIEVDGKLVRRIPLDFIDSIIIYGNSELHASIIHHCTEHDISIIFCKANSEEMQMLLPKSHGDVALKLKQFTLYLDPMARLNLAKLIVQNKATAQINLLQKLASNCEVIHEMQLHNNKLISANSLAEVMGFEGVIARLYFSQFTQLFNSRWGFTARNKYPALDPVNIVLSFFYVILTKQCSTLAYAKGLDPKIGFLHETRYGRDSLACDLVEAIRCVADELTYELFVNECFNIEDFNYDADKCTINKNGRAKIFSQIGQIKSKVRKLLNENLTLLGLH